MPKKNKFFAYFAALVVAIIWGVHPVAIRVIIQDHAMDPLNLNALRSLMGAGFLCFLFCILYPKKIPEIWRLPKRKLFWVSVVTLTVANYLYHLSFKYTLATDVTLIANYSPVIVLIAYLIYNFRHRTIRLSQLPTIQAIFFTVLVGCIGTSIIMLNDPFESIAKNELKFLGDNIQFVGVIFWSLFLFCSHRYAKIHTNVSSMVITMVTLFLSGCILGLFSLGFSFAEYATMQPIHWYYTVALAIFPTAICYVLWYKASTSLHVITVVLLLNLTSVITALTESLVYGNVFSYKMIIGAVLIIGSAVYAEILNKRLEAKGI